MCNRELELGGVVCPEVTAAVVEQVVHELTVWALLSPCPEGLEDCDRLVDRKRMALNEGCQQMLRYIGI